MLLFVGKRGELVMCCLIFNPSIFERRCKNSGWLTFSLVLMMFVGGIMSSLCAIVPGLGASPPTSTGLKGINELSCSKQSQRLNRMNSDQHKACRPIPGASFPAHMMPAGKLSRRKVGSFQACSSTCQQAYHYPESI